MTGESIVYLSDCDRHPSPRFQRDTRLVLLAVAIAATATAGSARAEGGKRKGRVPAATALQPPPADATATPPSQNKPPVGSGDSPDAFYARKRGIIAVNTGHYEEAVKAFEEAYALNQDPALLFNLAQAYRLAGQPGKALDACSSFLRSANPTGADRSQVEHFMSELEMIIFQIRAQRDFRQPPAPPIVPAPIAPAPLEPPPVAAVSTPKPPALDLTPRTQAIATVDLTIPAQDTGPPPPYYRRTGFWLLASGAVVAVAAGAVLLWYFEGRQGLRAPTTALGYQQAYP
jgi:tetratricopeptide (TPR) repeat protein